MNSNFLASANDDTSQQCSFQSLNSDLKKAKRKRLIKFAIIGGSIILLLIIIIAIAIPLAFKNEDNSTNQPKYATTQEYNPYVLVDT